MEIDGRERNRLGRRIVDGAQEDGGAHSVSLPPASAAGGPANRRRLVRREESCDDNRRVTAASIVRPKGGCTVEAVGTARLTSEILAQRAVGASVSRSQIADVLHEPGGDPELVLDRVPAEGGEHATISMTRSRDDLERLLEAESGDEMMLMFDRDELATALGDVEAHGLRTNAAVFAVAAAGALGSGATIANATAVGADGGGIGATPVTTTSAADPSTAATLA